MTGFFACLPGRAENEERPVAGTLQVAGQRHDHLSDLERKERFLAGLRGTNGPFDALKISLTAACWVDAGDGCPAA
jgi:hypothetical protein